MWPEGFLLGIPRGHFAYSVLCDVASLRATSRTGIISEALCRKGASESERFRHNVRVYEKFRTILIKINTCVRNLGERKSATLENYQRTFS